MNKKFYTVVVLLALASILLAACQPITTYTDSPAVPPTPMVELKSSELLHREETEESTESGYPRFVQHLVVLVQKAAWDFNRGLFALPRVIINTVKAGLAEELPPVSGYTKPEEIEGPEYNVGAVEVYCDGRWSTGFYGYTPDEVREILGGTVRNVLDSNCPDVPTRIEIEAEIYMQVEIMDYTPYQLPVVVPANPPITVPVQQDSPLDAVDYCCESGSSNGVFIFLEEPGIVMREYREGRWWEEYIWWGEFSDNPVEHLMFIVDGWEPMYHPSGYWLPFIEIHFLDDHGTPGIACFNTRNMFGRTDSVLETNCEVPGSG